MTSSQLLDQNLAGVIHLLKHAAIEDNDALKVLNMREGFHFHASKPFNPRGNNKQLSKNVRELVYHTARLQHCKLTHVKRMCNKMLAYVLYAYETILEEPFTCDLQLEGQAVVHSTLQVVNDIIGTLGILRKVEGMERQKSNERKGAGGRWSGRRTVVVRWRKGRRKASGLALNQRKLRRMGRFRGVPVTRVS